jgi:hypothetical protein
MPKSSIAKRSIVFNGRKTSLSLEDEFWNALKDIAGKRAIRLSDVVAEIDVRLYLRPRARLKHRPQLVRFAPQAALGPGKIRLGPEPFSGDRRRTIVGADIRGHSR